MIYCSSPKIDTENKIIEADKENLTSLFSKLEVSQTGVSFYNEIKEDKDLNSFYYDYFYNGGGVACGDIDNDGLVDLYFTGNMRDNRLYRNLGGFKFEDISNQSNTLAKGSWSTGTSFVDINADGFLDLYVCRSFNAGNEDIQRNLLYINNGDLTFTERAKAYGLDDSGFSVQASFFDYDKDGDLDVYVVNHPVDYHPEDPSIRFTKWKNPNLKESNHLYENKGGGTFIDVTVKAGLLSYDFTLGVITADINGDGWPDIYTTNDYEHPDRYFINNKDGSFTEGLKRSFRHISNFAMGVDFADINNDSLGDLAVVDMVAEDNYRQKTMMPSMNPDIFWRSIARGYHYQYMRNSLQLNNGDGTFAEIGQLSGIQKTDWSWSVLLADFDLDGWKDMFITNGYYRDTRNVDYRNYYKKHYSELKSFTDEQVQEILNKIPSQKIGNYYFKNKKNLQFENKSKEVGIDMPSFSNGASYADLDNDGDLDLVVNNLSETAFLYRNNSIESGDRNFLNIKLEGSGKNLNGIGAKLTLKNKGKLQSHQHIISRGYQSGVSNIIHFGLGKEQGVEELIVEWPSGKVEKVKDIHANQVLLIKESNAIAEVKKPKQEFSPLFKSISNRLGIDFRHIENQYDDYVKEILLPHKMSQFGPKIAVGDVNGDQLDDVFIGGASGSVGKMYVQQEGGTFITNPMQALNKDYASEDIASLFFDADNDGDQDLYVVSGGNEFEAESNQYADRLYINDGEGNFIKSNNILPESFISGSCVIAEDYDKDGDLDLFVGGRQVPGKYPSPTKSSILENRNGTFEDVTKELAPELESVGMVTTALWSDFDKDGNKDLVITGEWMPIRFFKNEGDKFKELTQELSMDSTNGWWNIIREGDFNQDGMPDYVVGNLGKNYKYKASKKIPFPVYMNDFDENGTMDIVLGYNNKGKYYPVRGKECSSQQMPNIKKKFPTFHEFGMASLSDIYGSKLESSLHYNAYEFASVILENKGGKFQAIELPIEAQFSSIQGIIVNDFTGDNVSDILLAGNFFVSEVETGRADASTGLLLKGEGNFNFSPVKSSRSGFFAPLDVRDLQLFYNAQKEPIIAIGNNNSFLQIVKHNQVNSGF